MRTAEVLLQYLSYPAMLDHHSNDIEWHLRVSDPDAGEGNAACCSGLSGICGRASAAPTSGDPPWRKSSRK
ncbi:MAG: hypothetical protein EOO27_22620 [Comamonadaceae bacterium]|nr:MAG: hypothetical protein EOO27_22620 [Comamonadaceae bacterium]